MLLYSRNPRSLGAKRLARALGCRRIRHRDSLFQGRRHPWVVNWGSTVLPPWKDRVRLLNAPRAVERVSNKMLFFLDTQGHGIIPDWTDSPEEAQGWLNNGKSVVERHVLNGSGGLGIRIVDNADELSAAPLYVEYIKKKAEYRVHLFQGRIIDTQQKIRRNNQEPLDWRVRSYSNGFMYVREGIRIPVCVLDVAIQCMQLTDLHFGAVDVIYNERQDRAYVLEINTAPGLEGRTVQSYTQAIGEYVQ